MNPAADIALPLITVAMPVYNGGEYVKLAVNSIIRQSFTNWELLIYDDGSTDNALIDIAKIADNRIHLFRDGLNKGLAVRLNEAIGAAKGKYFARMDHDDVSFPDRFARQLEALQGDVSLDLVAVRALIIDGENQATGLFPYALSHEDICRQPWLGFYMPHPTWMGRTEWFKEHLYSIPAPYYCEDQELLLRSYRASKFKTLDALVFAYRIEGTISLKKLFKARLSLLYFQIKIFYKFNAISFLALSVVVTTLKLVNDLVKALRYRLHLQPTRRIDSAVIKRWNETLLDITLLSNAT